ncbi:aminomethyl-transferring glycine dehydrogenase subunit GcvPB [Candidatus Methanodesulfokora washburnensis]|uniref:glycine dehydrogenase (aminomethyl-transferring) n=1 Tax=Candidatus Methanodesulfokora washburnensis TaxID=2478471 RepID=A0A429GTM5_9CREN|nr:aminomethyl-transferring glycine dehydrogenase subunit GcvPB [Candidatus Methanodesulfokores washburnensis]RSN77125.1 glycine dehydrogenase subunit 2 [Candidatus Methanodesulfokores washburnensis]
MRFIQARWQSDEKVLEPTVFELSSGSFYSFPVEEELKKYAKIPNDLRRDELNLPGLSEPEVARHFSRLAEMNYGVDSNSYWLGSCTMKYNPKLNERIAREKRMLMIHPYQPEETVQGALQIMYELSEMLSRITGLPHFTLQPAAGAHGELTGALIIRKRHEDENERRNEMIVPESAHGSNFASAAMAGFKVIRIPPDEDGCVDISALKAAVSERTAGMMITNPNTLGIFESRILEISDVIHGAGGLLYYDGANLNAIIGKVLLSKMGIDIAHLNLHKTFSAPHGSGGPGAGAVGVVDELKEYLPVPVVRKRGDGSYYLDFSLKKTIGRVRSFYGNFNVMIKAWAYLKALGSEGLPKVAEISVLNANYALFHIRKIEGIDVKYGKRRPCKHEFVVSLQGFKKYGVKALDFAKRLLDYGVHPPTIYFPHIVEEAFMMEPTESESLRDLDNYIEAMRKIAEEARENRELLLKAPHSTAIGRLDEARASRQPILSWRMYRKIMSQQGAESHE